jgi:hypothetical protein
MLRAVTRAVEPHTARRSAMSVTAAPAALAGWGRNKGYDVSTTRTAVNSAATLSNVMDPWSSMISRLKGDGSGRSPHGAEKPSQTMRQARRESAASAHRSGTAERAHTPATRPKSTRVTFVERFTAKSISITWRDSTAANYSEQLWIRRIARSNGVCALTGAPIVRGDAVYGPAGRTSVRPANCAQMVLANVLEELE